jgi:hypothetical protein
MYILTKNKTIIPLLAILLLYLTIRIPLLNKPLQHDEIYFTSTYLSALPSSQKQPDNNTGSNEEFGWNNDWQRHLSFRIPSVFLFYYYWDRVFGDSEISVHWPALILGLIGIILYYYLGLLLFNPRISLLAAAATTLSISHIGLSTTATFLIFEFCVFGATLLSATQFLLTQNRKFLYLTMILNIFGVLIFYHYFAYLFLQTLLFWFKREKLRIPRYYFVGAVTSLLGFTMMFFYFYLHGWFDYGAGFWLTNNLSALLSVIIWLPFSFIAERVISSSLKLPMLLFCIIPFILFCIGSAKTMSVSLKSRDTHAWLRLVILISFILPFTLYLLGGVFGINIGHGQNFFYLLTIYYLFAFYGLEKLNISNRIKSLCLAVIFAAFLVFAVLGGPVLWKYKMLEKEMVRIASTAKADFNIFITPDSFINSYYARKFDVRGKSCLFPDNPFDEILLVPYLNDCLGDQLKVKRFVIIRKITAAERPLNNTYIIGKREFKLAKTDLYQYDYFPFQLLQKLIQHPLVLEIDTFQLLTKNPAGPGTPH